MEDKYIEALRESGKKGGLARAAKYRESWDQAVRIKAKKVRAVALKSPHLTQIEIAKIAEVSQGFVSRCLRSTSLKIEILQKQQTEEPQAVAPEVWEKIFLEIVAEEKGAQITRKKRGAL